LIKEPAHAVTPEAVDRRIPFSCTKPGRGNAARAPRNHWQETYAGPYLDRPFPPLLFVFAPATRRAAPDTREAAFHERARRLRTKPVDGSWQERAWLFYDETPEVRFAARWYSNAMSRARLIAGRRDEEVNVAPLPSTHRASELVAEIAGGPNGQAQLLKNFGPHLVVSGEGWIVVRPKTDAHGNEIGADWRVLSTQEVKLQGTKLVAEIDGDEVTIRGGGGRQRPDRRQ
jgi:hypothetical protein